MNDLKIKANLYCFYLIFTQMPVGCCSEPKSEKYGFQELQWEFKIKK